MRVRRQVVAMAFVGGAIGSVVAGTASASPPSGDATESVFYTLTTVADADHVFAVSVPATAAGQLVLGSRERMQTQWYLGNNRGNQGLQLRNRWSGQCMAATGLVKGSPVVQSACSDSETQLWQPSLGAGGAVDLRNAYNGQYLQPTGVQLGAGLVTKAGADGGVHFTMKAFASVD